MRQFFPCACLEPIRHVAAAHFFIRRLEGREPLAQLAVAREQRGQTVGLVARQLVQPVALEEDVWDAGISIHRSTACERPPPRSTRSLLRRLRTPDTERPVSAAT